MEHIKRPKSDNISSKTPMEQVASIDDLLMEILSRLPVRSLLQLMSVSKHYYFLISTPDFKLLRSRNRDPPSGLFVPVKSNKPYQGYEFVPFDNKNPVNPPFKTISFDSSVERVEIEHSCNGLMICSSKSVNRTKEYKYCIYNPTINRFATLPILENYDKSDVVGMTLVYDPSRSPHYVVVYVCALGKTSETRYEIKTYSSQTRGSKPSVKFSPSLGSDINFRTGVCWNNGIHWLCKTGFVLFFNLDQEIVRQIQTPSGRLGLDFTNSSSYVFESRDRLLLVEVRSPVNWMFKIHELASDYSGWFVRYRVDLMHVVGSFFKAMSAYRSSTCEFDVLSLVLGEKEDDSFLVLRIHGKAVRFNLESKNFYELRDLSEHISFGRGRVCIRKPDVFLFTESLRLLPSMILPIRSA